MRSVVLTASLLTTLWFGMPAAAGAQEPAPAPAPQEQPPPPPPPPPAREYAVPRSERVVIREGQARAPEPRGSDASAPAVRENEARPADARVPVRSSERVRETDSDNQRRQPVNAASASSANENADQGAQRRGASRRPPSGDSGRSGSSGAQARDRAVPRGSVPRQDPQPVYVYRDYWSYNRYYNDPYYYGGFGLGYLQYSPWGWTPAFYGSPYGYGYGYGGGYPGGRYMAQGYDIGSVKLKVNQRDAEVLVDGYFAGYVDDFDGFLQSLKLDSGAYRIEIRKPGFETLHFDVRVQPNRNITFRADMKPVP